MITLIIDKSGEHLTFEEVGIKEIMHWFNKLDMLNHSCILFEVSDDFMLIVGGGKGDYIVQFVKNDQIWTLKGNECLEGTKELIIGGQPGRFSSWEIVNEPQALEAIEYFFNHQEMDPHLVWIPN